MAADSNTSARLTAVTRRQTYAMRQAIAVLVLLIAATASAAEYDPELEEAAKQEENRLSGIVNLQVQNATNYLIGPNERAQNVLSLAPILPFRLTSWLVVNNSISVPLVWSPDITNKTDSTFGMGDITLSSPFTVTLKEIFFVALGPTFAFPTATDARLGSYDSGKFSLGPEATIEVTPSHWVLGLSVGNIWSVAGRNSGSTVNAFNLSPSITFNLPWGYYLATSSAIGAAWTVPGDERWAVSWGGGLGAVELFRIDRHQLRSAGLLGHRSAGPGAAVAASLPGVAVLPEAASEGAVGVT